MIHVYKALLIKGQAVEVGCKLELVALKAPKKDIWRTQQQRFSPEIMIQFLEIVHRPSKERKKVFYFLGFFWRFDRHKLSSI